MRKRKDGPCKKHDKYDYTIEDTRAYGLYTHNGNGKGRWVKIDPKKFQKENGVEFTEQQLQVINKRRTHYFQPCKDNYDDYYCNHFVETIKSIISDWKNSYKQLIKNAIEQIEKPSVVYPGDYDNLQMGISSPVAAQVWADQHNFKKEFEYKQRLAKEVNGLYSQFIQQSASRIEAVTVRVLTLSNAIKNGRFDRNVLYGTAAGKRCAVEDLPSFKYYDMLYCLWNFIKHNSKTTYDTLYERYPRLLIEDSDYKQGALAIYFIKFSDEMVLEILNGCIQFFKEYCELVFNEVYAQAQWNYNEYFLDIVKRTIEDITNPWGFDWWDEID